MLMAITYGDEKFKQSAEFNLWTAKHVGHADVVKAYDPSDIDEIFRIAHNDILSQKRGAGYWLWKPYIILKALEQLSENDYLMYLDAGAFYVRDIHHLVRQLEHDGKDILLSSSIFPVEHWCKRDAFELMDCDFDEMAGYHMIEAGYLLLKKTEKSLDFLKKWLKYMGDIRIVTDMMNTCGLPNALSFRENRHDQTVLTLLAYKEGIEPYKGISDSSELRKYIFYKDYQYVDYTREELIQLSLKEHFSPIYKKSNYSRIAVNSRIRETKKMLFYVRVIKAILLAFKIDTVGRIKERKYLVDL